MSKFTYTEWEEKLKEFNTRSFRSNIQKNKQAIKEGLMPGSIAQWMDLNKELWHHSKYKQISERFDPDWFRPAAILWETTGNYSRTPFGSNAYNQFWTEEYRRCQEGFEINGYRCPGDLYYWLNYYVLPVRKKLENGDVEESLGHPVFLEYHYVWSHYLEWCWRLEVDAVCLKPRGCGFSEYAASTATCTYTTRKGSKTMMCASADGYLHGGDGVMTKSNSMLDWLNTNTNLGMKKLRHVSDTVDIKTSGVKNKEGTTSGWLSTIMAKVIDKPNKLRGSRCRYVFMEEAGSFKGLEKSIRVAKALVVTGGIRMGTLVVWGTGGDEESKGENIAGLMASFYAPESLGMLGLNSTFTPGWEEHKQGFFFPTYMVSFRYYDNHGVVDGPLVLQNKVTERKLLEIAGNSKGLIDSAAEDPFNPADSFNQAGTNVFNRIKLESIKRNLGAITGIPKVRCGELIWNKNDAGKITGVRFEEMPSGMIEIIEEPERDRQGNVHKNLYIGGVDGIDYGVANSAIGEKGSKFAIVIKKKYLNSERTNNIYVAKYVERPQDEREAFERALKLAVYYNARLNVERTRKEVISYFRQRKMLRFLSKEVSIVTNNFNPSKAKKMALTEGTKINVKTIDHYINLIKDLILDYGDNIYFPDMIDNLINFSYELKGRFDLVVAMGMCELLDEDDSALNVVVKKHVKATTRKLFGYWTDAQKYKHFGEIPDGSNKTAADVFDNLKIKHKNFMEEDEEYEDAEQESSPFTWSAPDEKDVGIEFEFA